MSYEKIKKMSISRPNLTVKFTYASNNVTDYYGRLIYEDVSKTFKTEAELEAYLIVFANDVLGGMIRLPRTHALMQRITYLLENKLTKEISSIVNYEEVIDNETSRKVLTGAYRIPTSKYIITNGVHYLKSNPCTIKLKHGSKNATKFLSKKQAENYLTTIEDWKNKYNLVIEEVK